MFHRDTCSIIVYTRRRRDYFSLRLLSIQKENTRDDAGAAWKISPYSAVAYEPQMHSTPTSGYIKVIIPPLPIAQSAYIRVCTTCGQSARVLLLQLPRARVKEKCYTSFSALCLLKPASLAAEHEKPSGTFSRWPSWPTYLYAAASLPLSSTRCTQNAHARVYLLETARKFGEILRSARALSVYIGISWDQPGTISLSLFLCWSSVDLCPVSRCYILGQAVPRKKSGAEIGTVLQCFPL